jgi:UDP-N-acetyl-2-amino-2-deoxyglucuronate dehydrogenase
MARGRRFGIVGAGAIASTHAQAIAQLTGADLVAVTDAKAESAEAMARRYHCAAEPDLKALLTRDDVDIVSICVPSGLHAEVGVQAAAAGKHVLVEKPIDVTLAAADRLIDAAAAAGVRLTVVSQHRFDPGIVELRGLIDGGELGRLLLGEASTKWHRTQSYYDSAAWRGTWALDGGSLMNQGIHYVDLLLACMGPVAEVTAVYATQTHQVEVEDTALALLRFRSGALGTLVSSTSVFPGFAQRLEITGTGGTVIVEDGAIIERGLISAPPGRPERTASADRAAGVSTPAVGVASHAAQIADFVDAIELDRQPLATGQDGRAALEVVIAVYESASHGRAVQLPTGASR